MTVNCKIDSFTDVPVSEQESLLRAYTEVDGWIPGAEVKVLRDACRGKVVLEIGSYKGKSACIIAPVAKKLICVDTFCADGSGQNQLKEHTTLNDFKKNTQLFKNIEVLIGNSSEIIPMAVCDDSIDVIFVDGMHFTEYVERDILACWSKLKMNGTMLFHDTDWMSRERKGPLLAMNKYFTKEELQKNIGVTSISAVVKIRKSLKGQDNG